MTLARPVRYAELLGSQPVLPVFAALSEGDTVAEASAFRSALGSMPAPLGSTAAPPGIDQSGIPGTQPGPGARTHYAFDSSGAGGPVRVIVIDNSSGSLEASSRQP